jgi:hypothetical protein
MQPQKLLHTLNLSVSTESRIAVSSCGTLEGCLIIEVVRIRMRVDALTG